MSTELLTTAEVAERLGCSQQWIQALIKRGKLKAEMVGKTYVIRARDLDKYEPQPIGRPTTRTKTRPQKRSASRNGK